MEEQAVGETVNYSSMQFIKTGQDVDVKYHEHM
jgi:hypothetical protein